MHDASKILINVIKNRFKDLVDRNVKNNLILGKNRFYQGRRISIMCVIVICYTLIPTRITEHLRPAEPINLYCYF